MFESVHLIDIHAALVVRLLLVNIEKFIVIAGEQEGASPGLTAGIVEMQKAS
jgi:hypothetical protein